MVLDVIEDCKAGDKIVITVLLTNGNSKEFTVKLRANVGQSSYTETLEESNKDSSGGTFDFPFGE
jgi:copper(I)-binding protein